MYICTLEKWAWLVKAHYIPQTYFFGAGASAILVLEYPVQFLDKVGKW